MSERINPRVVFLEKSCSSSRRFSTVAIHAVSTVHALLAPVVINRRAFLADASIDWSNRGGIIPIVVAVVRIGIHTGAGIDIRVGIRVIAHVGIHVTVHVGGWRRTCHISVNWVPMHVHARGVHAGCGHVRVYDVPVHGYGTRAGDGVAHGRVNPAAVLVNGGPVALC